MVYSSFHNFPFKTGFLFYHILVWDAYFSVKIWRHTDFFFLNYHNPLFKCPTDSYVVLNLKLLSKDGSR